MNYYHAWRGGFTPVCGGLYRRFHPQRNNTGRAERKAKSEKHDDDDEVDSGAMYDVSSAACDDDDTLRAFVLACLHDRVQVQLSFTQPMADSTTTI